MAGTPDRLFGPRPNTFARTDTREGEFVGLLSPSTLDYDAADFIVISSLMDVPCRIVIIFAALNLSEPGQWQTAPSRSVDLIYVV
jgi:hypothetical protein